MEFDQSIAEQIPPEYRDDPMVKESSDLPAFVKRAVETKKMVGNSIQLPKAEDAPEVWHEKVYSKLGVPKTADEYKIERGDVQEWDDDLEKSIRQVAHQNGVTPKALQEMVNTFNGHVGGKMKASMVSPEQVVESLKKELGGDYEAKVGMATELVNKIDGRIPGFKAMLDSTVMIENTKDGKKIYQANAHPFLAKVLAELAPAFGEDFASPAGKQAGSEDGAAIDKEIGEIRAKANQTQDDKKRLEVLYKKKYGTKEVA